MKYFKITYLFLNTAMSTALDVSWQTVVEGDPKAPFSMVTAPREGASLFPGFLYLLLIRTL